MKRILAAACVTAVSLGAGALAAPVSREVSWWASARAVPVAAYANGARLGSDALMLKGLGRTVLPMRVLFTALGANVDWHPVERAAYAWKPDGTGVRFTVGQRSADVLTAGSPMTSPDRASVTETRELDAPPMLIGNTVYIPVRAAADALHAEVRWAGSGPAVYLSTAPTTATASPSTDWEQDIRAVTMVLAIDPRTARAGTPVTFGLTLQNTGDRPVTLPFTWNQRFDFTVSRGGRTVWDWARGRVFTQALAPMRLMPGEKTSFSTTWDQVGDNGKRVAPGDYQVRARMVTPLGTRPLTVSQPITVTR